jgi:hypothetical protein
MKGSIEMQSDELEALRHQDFDDFCQEIEADHEREQDILEAMSVIVPGMLFRGSRMIPPAYDLHDVDPEPGPWLDENEPMSPRLVAACLDLRIKFEAILSRRRYQHSREWL